MIKNRFGAVQCLAVLAAMSVFEVGGALPLSAQEKPPAAVKATDASGLLAILEAAGYETKLYPRKDEDSPASIELTTRGGYSSIIFSDCKDSVPDFCETLVFSTKWNRDLPISDSAIVDANRKLEYVSVWRNEDGDPVVQWAILTRDIGVSPALFLNALQRYLDVVSEFDEVAFEGDDPVEKTSNEQSAT
jgi:hypothetical protein